MIRIVHSKCIIIILCMISFNTCEPITQTKNGSLFCKHYLNYECSETSVIVFEVYFCNFLFNLFFSIILGKKFSNNFLLVEPPIPPPPSSPTPIPHRPAEIALYGLHSQKLKFNSWPSKLHFSSRNFESPARSCVGTGFSWQCLLYSDHENQIWLASYLRKFWLMFSFYGSTRNSVALKIKFFFPLLICRYRNI